MEQLAFNFNLQDRNFWKHCIEDEQGQFCMCVYYRPKQYPFMNPNAGRCLHPDVEQKCECKECQSARRRGKKESWEHKNAWIPYLKECPGKKPIP